MTETIEQLTPQRVVWITREHTAVGYRKPEGYFHGCLAAQDEGQITLLLSRCNDKLLGWVQICWRPDDPHLLEKSTPQIQDLNVLAEHHRKRVASRLMDVAEDLIRETSPVAALSVGLHAWYGAAQRLYALRGYVPDGRGVTYRHVVVEAGQVVKADDHLVLNLIKNLM